jgi:hypothetical protein
VKSKRSIVVAVGVLAALGVVAIATREKAPRPTRRGAAAGAETADLDCEKVREDPAVAAGQSDPRRFAAAYFCAWGRKNVAAMRKTTLSPQELDSVLRPPLGPEAGAERRDVIRRRAVDAYLNLPAQVNALYAGVRFSIDSVRRLPDELDVFEEGAHPRLLEFRAQAPGKEEEALRTVLVKAGGDWRFVPGIAEPEPGELPVRAE